MKNNYVIVNADSIQKRIEELEPSCTLLNDFEKHLIDNQIMQYEIKLLKEILSQSIPLIPTLKEVYLEGNKMAYGYDNALTVEQYIENLNLEI